MASPGNGRSNRGDRVLRRPVRPMEDCGPPGRSGAVVDRPAAVYIGETTSRLTPQRAAPPGWASPQGLADSHKNNECATKGVAMLRYAKSRAKRLLDFYPEWVRREEYKSQEF